VCLWNPYRDAYEEAASTGALLLKQYKGGHGQDVRCLSASADGSRFASAGGDRCAFVWDVATGAVLRRLYGHEASLGAVALGGEGSSSLCVTGSDDMSIRVADLRAGGGGGGGGGSSRGGPAPLAVLTGFKDSVSRVAVSEHSVLGASMDGSIREWDLRSAKLTVQSLPAPAPAPAAASGAAESMPSSQRRRPPPPISALALSKDWRLALAATPGSSASSSPSAGALLLLDRLPSSSAVLSVLRGHANRAYRLQPALLLCESHAACGSEEGDIVLWQLASSGGAQAGGALAGRETLRLRSAHSRSVACVASSELPSRAALAAVAAGSASSTAAATPSVLLSASFDGSAKLWVPQSCLREVQELAEAPDGRKDPALLRALGHS
jgi:mitogen-activated protein kinase organizer 1